MSNLIRENKPDYGLPEFINAIPENWKKYRVCYLLRNGHEGMKIGPFGSQLKVEEMISVGYKVYGQENVIARDFNKGIRFINEAKFKELQVYEIKTGDILITMMGSSGRCQIVTSDIVAGIMDSHLVRLRVIDSLIYPQFFQLLIEEAEYLKYQIKILGKGSIMHGLNSTIIKNLQVLLPPLISQNSILQFIEHKTGLIDQYLANKQRQIELLEKLRMSIISEAVTQGLNSDVEMRGTKIEWLGKIPKSWQLTKLKFVVRLVTSGSRGWAEHYSENGAIFVRITNIQRNSIELDFTKIQKVTPPLGSEGVRTILQSGDVLVSITADIGSIGVFPSDLGEAYVNQHTALVRPNITKINPRWLAYSLFSAVGKAQFSMLLQGGTKEGLELSDIKNLLFPKPSLEEQNIIVEYLDKQIGRIDQTLDTLKYQIAKIEAYRASLISEAVTGKIDVRDFQLPATATRSSQVPTK